MLLLRCHPREKLKICMDLKFEAPARRRTPRASKNVSDPIAHVFRRRTRSLLSLKGASRDRYYRAPLFLGDLRSSCSCVTRGCTSNQQLCATTTLNGTLVVGPSYEYHRTVGNKSLKESMKADARPLLSIVGGLCLFPPRRLLLWWRCLSMMRGGEGKKNE